MTGIPGLISPSPSKVMFPPCVPHIPSPCDEEGIRQRSITVISGLVRNKPKTKKIWEFLSQDPELNAHWDCANHIAVGKLGMNDHGKVHAMVAAASGLRILELVQQAGIIPDIVQEQSGDSDDASLIVLAAALCHDIGNQVHREDHISHSVMLAIPVISRILPYLYDDPARITRIRSGILSAIYSHHGDPRPLTIEAGAVCIGDASDMTTGRARSASDQGRVTIHTISALSVDEVSINQGTDVPVEILVRMSNSAGLFQVQEMLGPKIAAGPLRQHVEVNIRFTDESGGGERQILSGMKLVKGAVIEGFPSRN